MKSANAVSYIETMDASERLLSAVDLVLWAFSTAPLTSGEVAQLCRDLGLPEASGLVAARMASMRVLREARAEVGL